MVKECRNYFDEFIRKASNPYYADEKSDEECLIAALNVINDLEEENVELDDLSMFTIYNNSSQMAIGVEKLDLAKRLIGKAKRYDVNDFCFAHLNWREAQLYYKLGNKERSYGEYLSALDMLTKAHDENPYYKHDDTLYNIWAIKNQIARKFDDIDFSYKSLKDIIALYKSGLSSLTDVRDTYKIFTRLCDNINMIKYGVELLKVNNIVL